MKESKVSYSTFNSSLEAQLQYVNDPNFSKFFSKLSPGYENITLSDIAHYRSTIENLILDLLDDTSLIHVLNSTTKALKSAIILGARILDPNKEIVHPRSPTKSGLSIPASFYSTLNVLLSFIQKLFEKVPRQSIPNLSTDIFDLMLDILMKRKQTNGVEGAILSILSSIPQYSTQLWTNIIQISRMKDDKKIKSKLTSLTEGIKVIRHYPDENDSTSTESNLLEISNNINILKGKWSIPIILPIISSSLVFFYSKCKQVSSSDSLSSFIQAQFQFTQQNTTLETLLSFVNLFPFSNETDFNTYLPKLIQMLNKNYSSLSATSYFQVITQLIEGCIVRPHGCSNLFNLLISHWFNQNKQISINSPYKEDSLLLINVFSSLFKVAPKETEEFFLKLLNSNITTQTLNFLYSVIHVISVSEQQQVTKIAPAMVPSIKNIINKDEPPNEELQLVIPLLSLLWQNVPDFHSDITNLMIRCSKTKDITILGNTASFFIEIMEHYPIGSMPSKLLVTFSGQFLRRVDECVSEPILAKNFKLYSSYVKAFIDYAEKGKEVVDEMLWNQFLSLCESRLLVYALFPDINVTNIVRQTWKHLSKDTVVYKDKNPPLATVIPDITQNPIYQLSKHTNFHGFETRYLSLATYFAKPNGKIPKEFHNAIAKLLFALYKTKYYENNEPLNQQVVTILVDTLQRFSQQEIFNLVCLSDNNSWYYIIDKISNNTQITLPTKLKYVWSLSSHIKFCKTVLESEQIRKNLCIIFEAFIQSPLPKNESEQSIEVIGAEFCATFVRTISNQFKDEQIFNDFNNLIIKIISRLNPDSITLPDIPHVFALLELIHALLDTKPIDNNTVENVLDWTLYIALKTKGSTILQLQCHDVVLSLVKNNSNSLPLIMQCCFRASSLTTAHVASAIISSKVSSTDLAILSLGLSSRPSMICRAISAEIANTSSNAKFSPLACIDPLFEEKIVEFYASSFTPENVRKLMLQIPSLLTTGESDPSSVQHFLLLQNRLTKITKVKTVLTLLHLTAITEFSDLTPIKPLIPIWDQVFESPPDKLENILEMILNEVKSITDAKMLTACCISFSRAFFKYPKQTATFIIEHLRVTTDPNLSFDNFKPTTIELVISAVLSFIFDLETDRQRFVVCFLDHIRFILVWAIFLRFNPLYEHHHLPPLVTSIMHAAVPDSSLPLFVLAPSECVARAVYLPFRHTTELTSAQIASLLDVLKSFSKLTAELFLDTVAAKASSLAKYSPDFWILFSNFFQPIHSTTFLNSFIANAQNVDLENISMMLPILTGMVKQNADPSHIAGFIAVIIFIISSTNDMNFLKVINKHLPKFIDTVTESEDAEIISSTLLTIIDEHGGEESIVEGIIYLLQLPEKINSSDMNNVLIYLYEISKLLSISNAIYSYTSLILFIFDSFRWLESNGTEFMTSLAFLSLNPPNSYEELSDIIVDKWVPKIVSFSIKCIANFVGKTSIITFSFKKNIIKMIMRVTNQWKNMEIMPDAEKLRKLILMLLIGSDSENLTDLAKMFSELIETIGDSGEISLVESIQPLRVAKTDNNQIKRAIAQEATPVFVPHEIKHPLSEVCQYIQNNILN
ncbi:hypothetical protein GPJ56_004646 [Histomonas meleagridis]|uniref:uncharacterized protein n=1 Tax=Histomonas meleagridis TaxID=135588 RepID=UPI0035593868|nr:hypothetical protein GPJ56_004646 [Histomonas meleagridis]KAH0797408.1 hypothetical protein GO595_009729 [Histomonas meleagridis]